MIPNDWIEYRRPDGERLGWIRIDGETCTPIDLLGRELGTEPDWLAAEEALDAVGIGYLADSYPWHPPGGDPLVVLITQLDTDRIVIKTDDFGAIDAPVTEVELPFPMPAELRHGAERTHR